MTDVTTQTRRCTTCDNIKYVSEFYDHRSVCKPCIIARQREKRFQQDYGDNEVNLLMMRWRRHDSESTQVREEGRPESVGDS